MLLSLSPRFLFAVIAIPLTSPLNWYPLTFSKIPKNTVAFTEKGVTISVKSTASPLFYDLRKTEPVVGVSLKGLLSTPADISKGDDSYLRVGLVVDGKSPPSWSSTLFAPSWIKQLAEIVPGKMVERVYFLRVDKEGKLGEVKKHPGNDRIEEETVVVQTRAGEFTIEKTFSTPISTFALWVQSDGDDTKATFDVAITSLKLRTAGAR